MKLKNKEGLHDPTAERAIRAADRMNNKKICCKGNGGNVGRCEYDSAWFCKNPECKSPVLTSTMLGAHPSGCPKIDKWNRRNPENE